MPLFALQFTVPRLKQSGDGRNLGGLFSGIRRDLASNFTRLMAWRNLQQRPGGVMVDAFTELFEHLDGRANLGWGWSLHDDVRCGCRAKIFERVPVGKSAAFSK